MICIMFANLALYLLMLILSAINSSFAYNNCTYDVYRKAPELYDINLTRNSTRTMDTSEFQISDLRLKHHIIQGIISNNVYIPKDLLILNNNTNSQSSDQSLAVCKYQTKEDITTSIRKMKENNKTHLLHGVCTRDMKWTELYNTMSHLYAIYRAVHSTTTTSKYALIMEDNVHIHIDTDYHALAKSAPSDFGILQLMTTYSPHVQSLWYDYNRDPSGGLWTKRIDDLCWSTGFYLINRKKVRPIIDSIVHIDPLYPTVIQYRLIAAWPAKRVDVPIECMRRYVFTTPSLACIPTDKLVSDSFIYALLSSKHAPTYVSKLQLGYIPSTPRQHQQYNSNNSTSTNIRYTNIREISIASTQATRTTHTAVVVGMVLSQLAQMNRGNFTKPSKIPFRVACIY